MTLYFCVGCRTVHEDDDYCKEDGDLEITNWGNLLCSIEKIKHSQTCSKTSEVKK